MLVPGLALPLPLPLVLLLLLSLSSSGYAGLDSCADCENNGPWWPLFRPSQLLHSEFPEHQHQWAGGSGARVGRQAQAQASAELRVNGVARPDLRLSTSAPGLDRLVGRGRHRLHWEHFGVKKAALNAQNAQIKERAEHEGSESQEGSFFNDGSFFDDSPKTKDAFSKDFGESRESAEAVSNSLDSRELAARRRPATSYSSFRSIIGGGIRPPERRDLLHPDIPSNDVFKYIHSPNPVSRSKHLSSLNMSQPYMVHEPTSQERPFVPLDHPVYRYVKGHAPLGQVRRVAHEVQVEHVRGLPSRTPVKDSFWKSKSDEFQEPYGFQNKYPFPMTPWKSKIGGFKSRRDGFSASPVDKFWKEHEKSFQVRDETTKSSLPERFLKSKSDIFQSGRTGFSASPVDPFWKESGKEIHLDDDIPDKSTSQESTKYNDFDVHQRMFSEEPSTTFLKDSKLNDEFKMDFELPKKDSFQDILKKESKHEMSLTPTKLPFLEHSWRNKEFYLNHAGSNKIPVRKDYKKIDLLKPSGQTLFFFRKKPNVLDLKKSALKGQSHGHNYAYFVKNNKKIMK